MMLLHRTACNAMMVAVIAMLASGCASTAPGTAPTDQARQAENQRKQADLKAMEQVVVRDNDGTPVPAGTIK